MSKIEKKTEKLEDKEVKDVAGGILSSVILLTPVPQAQPSAPVLLNPIAPETNSDSGSAPTTTSGG